MRWLVDGYNVIRRAPELKSREQESLEAGRQALCALLAEIARVSGDSFTVVFDGAQAGGRAGGGAGVSVIFSSARESADSVLARMAREGGAVVSNDREVRRAAERAGATVVTTDQFLTRLDQAHQLPPEAPADLPEDMRDGDEEEPSRGPRKGNPRRLSKKDRAAQRALGRLRPGHHPRAD
jgi:predicted RNA-binding protein with PIN domain